MARDHSAFIAWMSFGYAVFGLLLCGGIGAVVMNQSAPKNRSDNLKLVFILVPVAIVCMWTQWVCCYMHQMHPLELPEPEE